MAQRHVNTVARRQAIQVLYQMEIAEQKDAEEALAQANPVDEVVPAEYAAMLVRGTMQNRYAIDRQIKRFSENWSLDRMPVVDRAVLRLACYEMMFVDECPISVAINEAVDLAKEFGGEDESPRFVNGVLGRIADDIEAKEAEAKEAEAKEAEARAAAENASAEQPSDGQPVEAQDPAEQTPAEAQVSAEQTPAE